MRFVDREKEMARLQQLLKADSSEEDQGNSLLPVDVLRLL